MNDPMLAATTDNCEAILPQRVSLGGNAWSTSVPGRDAVGFVQMFQRRKGTLLCIVCLYLHQDLRHIHGIQHGSGNDSSCKSVHISQQRGELTLILDMD